MLDVAKADAATMQPIRGNEIGMIFQEPMTTPNLVQHNRAPVDRRLWMTHRKPAGRAATTRALELLKEVRILELERRLHAVSA